MSAHSQTVAFNSAQQIQLPNSAGGVQACIFDVLDPSFLGSRARATLYRLRQMPDTRHLTVAKLVENRDVIKEKIALLPRVGPQTYDEFMIAMGFVLLHAPSIGAMTDDHVSLAEFTAKVETAVSRSLTDLGDDRIRQILQCYYGVLGTRPANAPMISSQLGISRQRVLQLKNSGLQKISLSPQRRQVEQILDRHPSLAAHFARQARDAQSPLMRLALDADWMLSKFNLA